MHRYYTLPGIGNIANHHVLTRPVRVAPEALRVLLSGWRYLEYIVRTRVIALHDQSIQRTNIHILSFNTDISFFGVFITLCTICLVSSYLATGVQACDCWGG